MFEMINAHFLFSKSIYEFLKITSCASIKTGLKTFGSVLLFRFSKLEDEKANYGRVKAFFLYNI